MKKDLSPTRNHLVRALQSLPQDFALAEVTSAIHRALSGIDYIEKKRSRSAQPQETLLNKWQQEFQQQIKPHFAQDALKKIEKMLQEENQKLENIQRKESDATNVDTILD